MGTKIIFGAAECTEVTFSVSDSDGCVIKIENAESALELTEINLDVAEQIMRAASAVCDELQNRAGRSELRKHLLERKCRICGCSVGFASDQLEMTGVVCDDDFCCSECQDEPLSNCAKCRRVLRSEEVAGKFGGRSFCSKCHREHEQMLKRREEEKRNRKALVQKVIEAYDEDKNQGWSDIHGDLLLKCSKRILLEGTNGGDPSYNEVANLADEACSKMEGPLFARNGRGEDLRQRRVPSSAKEPSLPWDKGIRALEEELK